MKVPLKWLQDYVDISIPLDELTEKLTMAGTEVSAVCDIGGGWEKVVVGRLAAVERHPNADRLTLATVELGRERLTVVCGAPNLKVGDKVPFAHVGARLIDGYTGQLAELKPAKIRGVESRGMVCSEKELGLSDRHETIMVLPQEAPIGVPLADYLGDTVLDFKLTPNRPDCLSVIGLAREIAALTKQATHVPEIHYGEEGPLIEGLAFVEVHNPELCSRYCASLIREIRVGPSPRWMQERLTASGMRPINNIVDITNYVMLEYGQPLHAFDYEKIRERRIIVRRAEAGEVLMTLDGVARTLDRDILAIADPGGPIAIAGVMGGSASEVTGDTTTILLESANFNGANIRRTAGGLRLRSEASSRFEKGLSPELPLYGLRRATQLMVELAGGKAAKGVIDVYPGQKDREPILLTRKRVSQVLGVELSLDAIKNALDSLGFLSEPAGPYLMVTVPYWRTDVRLADDLVEEVARVIGYDEIPTTTLGGRLPSQQPASSLVLRERVRDILVGCGMQEVITYSLTGLSPMSRVNPASSPVRVANPLSPEQEYLRTTLRANLMSVFSRNEKQEEGGIRIFEVGKVYGPRENDLPEEREMLAGVLGGPRFERTWVWDEGQMDFFDAKAVLETLFQRLGVEVTFEEAEDEITLRGRTAKVTVEGNTIGTVGELHPGMAASFDIASHPVSLLEVDLAKLLPLIPATRKHRSLPRFPGTLRDMALVVAADIPAKRVRDILQASPLVSQVTLFDVYTGEQVPPGKKSLAYRVIYQASDRTLTDREVDRAQEGVLKRLHRELRATLR